MFFTPVGLNRWSFDFFLVNLLKYIFMKRFIFLSMIFLSIGLFSCKKYSEGGLKNMAASHIRGTWKLETYLLNNIDFTGDLLINSYKETFNEEGTYSRQLIDTFNQVLNTSGGWDFEGERSLLTILGAGDFLLTAGSSTATAPRSYTIERLTKAELWYSYEDGLGKHDFRLIKQ